MTDKRFDAALAKFKRERLRDIVRYLTQDISVYQRDAFRAGYIAGYNARNIDNAAKRGKVRK